MLKVNKTMLALCSFCFVAFSSQADLFYDKDKSAEMANLTTVQSARITSEYLCGASALYITSNAASSEINGRSASVSAKIVTGDKSFDLSDYLTNYLSSDDILDRGMNVRCNRDSGAFKLVFSPGQIFTGNPEERLTITSIQIYADGYISGGRSRRLQKKD